MKKIIITFVIILPLLIFNKTIISQLIIFSTSKLTDRNISIETINIDYLKKKIIFILSLSVYNLFIYLRAIMMAR